MRTMLFAKALLLVAFAMTFSSAVTADPIVCDPRVVLAPVAGKSGLEGFLQRLLQGSEKPQAFSGAVMGEPDPACSLGLDTRPVADAPDRRSRRNAIN